MTDLANNPIWKKLRKQYPSISTPTPTEKRIALFLRLCLLCMGVISIHTVIDIFHKDWLAVAFDIVFLAIIAGTYLLDRHSYHIAAKTIFCLLINGTLFIYSNIIPREIGLYLFYFPLVLAYFIIYDYRERWLRLFWSCMSGFMLILLELSNYQFFGNIRIVEAPDLISYLINLSSSIFLIFFACNFITQLNYYAEEYLKAQADKIREQNEKLAKTNAELDKFVYSASHDLKAPLASVKGLIHLFEKEENQTNQHEYLQMMSKSIAHLERFIADITQYSRNERLAIEPVTINLSETFTEAIEDFNFFPGIDNIKTILNIPENMFVVTDKHRLLIVLNNLYSNAIKYHIPHHPEAFIQVNVWVNENILFFQVKDNGMGMNKEVQNRIFDMFFRGSETSSGSGLGLYIVKEVVSKMNGNITVDSKPGEGSTFTVSWPVKVLKEKEKVLT